MTCFLLLGLPARAQEEESEPATVNLPTLTADQWVSYCPSEKTRIPQKGVTEDGQTFNVGVYKAHYDPDLHTLYVNEINTNGTVYIGQKSLPGSEINGYLLKATVNGSYSVKQSPSYKNDQIIESGLRGTTSEITAEDFNAYFQLGTYDYLMVLRAGTSSFVHYTGTTFPANKAYFIVNVSGMSAPSIRIVDESETTTTLDDCEEEAVVTKSVQNGQLLIVRDGVTFDLMGRTIR